MDPFRGGGMQVHAVPDDERVFDSSGRQLPWGYAHADSSLNRKQPLEKGPFGRATNRRSVSRSKTATPSTREDLLRKENTQYTDQLFTNYKSSLEERQPAREQNIPMPSKIPAARPVIDVAATGPTAPAGPTARTFKEPTEVMLYGFGTDYQYAAIDFYERASNGSIYEDYDRQPPNPRYNNTLSTNRATIPRSLSQAAIRAINSYHGGDHWIKVTFDSPEAAEMACHYSPHIIHGFCVFAELYRGIGPSGDVAIRAESAARGGLINLQQPRRRTQQKLALSANTESNRSASGLRDSSDTDATNGLNISTSSQETTTASGTDVVISPAPESSVVAANGTALQKQEPRPLRIAGAKRAVLLPATDALLPVAPWKTRTFGHLPIIGSLFGGNGSSSDIIGPAIPRKEDGTFDWDHASFWWRWCFWIDYWLGTNICGLKGDD